MLDLTLDLNSFTKIQMQAANSVENVSDIVAFEDLTVLLANWNRNVATAEGNLVDPVDTPVNFEDLTVLLAAWTGPGPSPAPADGAAVPEPSPSRRRWQWPLRPSPFCCASAPADVGDAAVFRRASWLDVQRGIADYDAPTALSSTG